MKTSRKNNTEKSTQNKYQSSEDINGIPVAAGLVLHVRSSNNTDVRGLEQRGSEFQLRPGRLTQ